MPRRAQTPPRPAASPAARGVVIVESPNKAKTLRQLLGRQWEIIATVGHFCDLPERSLGVEVENGFRPTYVYHPDRKAVVAQLRALRERYAPEAIIVASDADREGEAIGWHIARTAGLRPEEVQRAEFHEITPAGVQRALSRLRPLDLGLVAAQEARRILDRLVGYSVSPVVRDRLPHEREVSAGRVQSVALRVVVDRENAIRAFVPEAFWRIEAHYPWPQEPAREWTAELVGRGEAARPTPHPIRTEAEAQAIAQALAAVPHRVARLERKESKRHPPAPLITATMLQRASARLGMSPEETTRHAKGLFEAGLVTYIRTDDPSVAPEFQRETLAWLASRYGAEIVPGRPNRAKAKGPQSQGAHECIRPTQLDDARAANLTGRARALYDMIRETYLASQCKPARYDVTEAWLSATAEANEGWVLKASGRILRDPGFLALFGHVAEEEGEGGAAQAPLPPLREGEAFAPLRVTPSEHWTRPPERFTEASLIKYLEARGIGRPSTYAAMVEKIRQRAFVALVDRRCLSPTPKGEAVDGELRRFFSAIIKEGFTAELETRLDAIARREENWRAFMADFWAHLTPLLSAARATPLVRSAEPPPAPPETPPARPSSGRPRRRGDAAGAAASGGRKPRKAGKGTATRPRRSAPEAALDGPMPPCPRCREAFLRPISASKDGRRYLVCGRDQPGRRLCGFIMAADDTQNPACPRCGAATRRLPTGGFGCVRWQREGGPESCDGRLPG
ncbi:MAG: type I DNA topoisomerase [Candidatus Sericytochromatia bacterium]|nr:type I DNA topoisomerase [Candidatus Sericytochromatia bacterium]